VMREIHALSLWGWLYKHARVSVCQWQEFQLPSHPCTDARNLTRRHGRDTSAQVRAHDGKRFVARGSEPPARKTKRSGKQECGGGSLTCQVNRCPK
jgi:hypothetical protein